MKTVAVAFAATMILCACNKPEQSGQSSDLANKINTASIVNQTPTQICSDSKNLDSIKILLIQNIVKNTEFDAEKDRDQFIIALKELWSSGIIKLDIVTLSSSNQTTKMTECSGRITISALNNEDKDTLKKIEAGNILIGVALPMAGKALAPAKVGVDLDKDASFSVAFSFQPAADGSDTAETVDMNDTLDNLIVTHAALYALRGVDIPAYEKKLEGCNFNNIATPASPDHIVCKQDN